MPAKSFDDKDNDRGLRLRKIRKDIFDGVTQEEFGALIGDIPGATVSTWENGGPIANIALANLDMGGIRLSYLLRGEGEMTRPNHFSRRRGERFSQIKDTIYPQGGSWAHATNQFHSDVKRLIQGWPIPETTLEIVKRFGFSVDWLINGIGEMRSSPTTAVMREDKNFTHKNEEARLSSTLVEAHGALSDIASRTRKGKLDFQVARQVVEEALDILWRVHGKQASKGKGRHSSEGIGDTGTDR